MAFELRDIVPWGRSFDEYRRMFALTSTDLELAIVGCADGPSSFNAELARQGNQIVSVDPLYHLSAAELEARIAETADEVIAQTAAHQDQFVWTTIPDVETLRQTRLGAMETFLADYELGKRQGRYVAAELPELPFRDRAFDLALCSHFLFLYSAQLDMETHIAMIEEMLRVAAEARIFPLLDLNAEKSVHVEPVVDHLRAAGYRTKIGPVPYEFQKGGNEMLKVYR